jgi:hypothetical protein
MPPGTGKKKWKINGETGREEFPQGLKARFSVSLDVGAKESVGELRKEALSGQILVDRLQLVARLNKLRKNSGSGTGLFRACLG